MPTRRATTVDLDALAPLFDAYRTWYGKPADPQAARAFLCQRLERDESVIYLATPDTNATRDTPIAFAQLYPTFSSLSLARAWILNDLFVHESHRRQGHAAALLDACIHHARGAASLTLETAPDNTPAQALYLSRGFTRDATFHHYTLQLNPL